MAETPVSMPSHGFRPRASGRNPLSQQGSPGSLGLLEGATALLRQAPRGILTGYYLGAIPLALGLLLYVELMGWSVLGEQWHPLLALLVTFLLIWHRLWQSLAADRMLRFLSGAAPTPLSLSRGVRLVLFHIALAPWTLLLVPLSVLTLVPVGQGVGFYYQVAILNQGQNPSLRELARDAGRQAFVRPVEGFQLFWLLTLLSLFVYLNLLMVASFLPNILHILTGWEGTATRGAEAFFNSTLSRTALVLTWLVLDPLALTALTLKTFLEKSRGDGQDLLAALRRATAPVLLAMCVGLLTGTAVRAAPAPFQVDAAGQGPGTAPYQVSRTHGGSRGGTGAGGTIKYRGDTGPGGGPASASGHGATEGEGRKGAGREGSEKATASETDVSLLSAEGSASQGLEPAGLDARLDGTLEGWKYAWRFPPPVEARPPSTLGNWLETYFDQIRDAWNRFRKWLKSLLKEEKGQEKPMRWRPPPALNAERPLFQLYSLSVLLAAVLLSAVAILMYRRYRQAGSGKVSALPMAPRAMPDLQDDSLSADALAPDEWASLGARLRAAGELRPALRAFFLSLLSQLGQAGHVRLERGRSNRDYLREVQRRDHALPALTQAFAAGMQRYEASWYGTEPVTEERLDLFLQDSRQVYEHLQRV